MTDPIKIAIPMDLDFSDLKLTRDLEGNVLFDQKVIERIATASGLPSDYFMDRTEDAVSELITHWYRMHLASGGTPDPVQDDLIEEIRLEDERGHGISHKPGRA